MVRHVQSLRKHPVAFEYATESCYRWHRWHEVHEFWLLLMLPRNGRDFADEAMMMANISTIVIIAGKRR